jgi:CBS domain containing-hemolysin-like protein
MDLQNLTVGQAAIPLTRVTSLRAESPVKEALALCREQNLTRLPVWGNDGSRNRIIGIINVSSLLYAPRVDESKMAREYLQPALFLDDQIRLEEALRRMQRSGRRLAIVLGPDQIETGILSVEDILGAIFGEVRL